MLRKILEEPPKTRIAEIPLQMTDPPSCEHQRGSVAVNGVGNSLPVEVLAEFDGGNGRQVGLLSQFTLTVREMAISPIKGYIP